MWQPIFCFFEESVEVQGDFYEQLTSQRNIDVNSTGNNENYFEHTGLNKWNMQSGT